MLDTFGIDYEVVALMGIRRYFVCPAPYFATEVVPWMFCTHRLGIKVIKYKALSLKMQTKVEALKRIF